MTIAQRLKDCIAKEVICSKTVGESDVLLFAGITGDFSPNHVNEEAMKNTQYGGRIAHGALLVGYMSRASSMIAEECVTLMQSHYPVSLGYDRVRFLHGVRIGDTITIQYRITEIDAAKARTLASVTMTNQRGETVAAATHLMSWLARNP
jgi:3-hydroxybutyryl-CoA dehydratase